MVDEALLYDLSDSPLCSKARMCLQLKRVPFRRVTLTFGRLRELRRLDPRGQVPVLIHDGEVIADSRAIARHLEVRYPEPSLFPRDPAARAYCLLIEEWAEGALSVPIGACKWLNPANRAAALANTFDEIVPAWARAPVGLIVAAVIRRRYRTWGHRVETLPHLEACLRDHLEVLATLLADRPYLLGRRATVADLTALAQLSSMRRYAEGRLLDDVPVVVRWLDRLVEEPAVAAAIAA